MQALLSTLCPVAFPRALDELQAVFHGGQGKPPPAATAAPRAAGHHGNSARFAVRTVGNAGGAAGGVRSAFTPKSAGRKEPSPSLAGEPLGLPAVARRGVSAWASGGPAAGDAFAARGAHFRKLLVGEPRWGWAATHQEHFTRCFIFSRSSLVGPGS